MYFSYVYMVINRITGQFYYGSRYKNTILERTPEDDFWIHYFTSSKKIKNLISMYGKESFSIQIIFRDEEYDTCFWCEQDLIKENISDPLCLNGTYIDRIHGVKFSTAGKIATKETRRKLSIAKSNPSEETRKKMSLAKKGKIFGPMTKERKENISKGLINRKVSESTCKNISKSKSGSLNPNYGKSRSAEMKAKSSATQLLNREKRVVDCKARWQDPEYRKMMLAARQKKK